MLRKIIYWFLFFLIDSKNYHFAISLFASFTFLSSWPTSYLFAFSFFRFLISFLMSLISSANYKTSRGSRVPWKIHSNSLMIRKVYRLLYDRIGLFHFISFESSEAKLKKSSLSFFIFSTLKIYREWILFSFFLTSLS